MAWIVTYTEAEGVMSAKTIHKKFATREEAEAFAERKRQIKGTYVGIKEVQDA